MPDVHDLLHWANRSEVAREITRRGYRVSVETLNRWHRDRKEVPAVVERIVFDLFGNSGHSETAPPWAERMERRLTAQLKLNQALIEDATPEEIAAVKVELDELRRLSPPPGAQRPPVDRHPRDGRAGIGQRNA